jgi:hypothetical protein
MRVSIERPEPANSHPHRESDRRSRPDARFDKTYVASFPVIDSPSSLPKSDAGDLLEEWSPEGSTVSED